MSKVKGSPSPLAGEGDYFEVQIGTTVSVNYNSIRLDVKYGSKPHGGETLEEFANRVKNFATDKLNELSKENEDFLS